MADWSRHVYRATAALEEAPDGTLCRVFVWEGRMSPPLARPANQEITRAVADERMAGFTEGAVRSDRRHQENARLVS